jgi:hypothetical protein
MPQTAPAVDAAFSLGEDGVCAILPRLAAAPEAASFDAARGAVALSAAGAALAEAAVPPAVAVLLAAAGTLMVAELGPGGAAERFSAVPLRVAGR